MKDVPSATILVWNTIQNSYDRLMKVRPSFTNAKIAGKCLLFYFELLWHITLYILFIKTLYWMYMYYT